MHWGSTVYLGLSASSHGSCELASTAAYTAPGPCGVRFTRIASPSTMKLSAIASALDVRLENGSPDTEITGLNGIELAGPGELTFVSNSKYSAAARTTRASAVIVGEDFPAIAAAMLRAKDPYLTFARALELFHQPVRYAPGVHATAVVHASARIGASAHVGPYVVVDEDVEIGDNAVLLAHVVIYRGVQDRRQLFRARAFRGSRKLPHREQCAVAERSRDWSGWIRIRQDCRGTLAQDSAARAGGD